jgi:hypothetical protein
MRRTLPSLSALVLSFASTLAAAQSRPITLKTPAPTGQRVAAALPSGPDAASAQRDEVLTGWARLARAQRDRVLVADLESGVSAALLSLLERGVRGCDCYTRRIRWAWAVPNPKDREHPSIVIAFNDPPRVKARVLEYLRLAYVRHAGGRYVVTSSLMLKRPVLTETRASLDVRLKPRRDVDDDGQLDVVLHFAEQWPDERFCGRATFASSADQVSIDEETCDSEPTVSLDYP